MKIRDKEQSAIASILLVTNIQTIGNPALWFIWHALKDRYKVHISGAEKLIGKSNPYGSHYTAHSYLFALCSKLKLTRLLMNWVKWRKRTLGKDRDAWMKKALLSFRLQCNAFEFNMKVRGVYDLIIHIDPEAPALTGRYQSKFHITSLYFIYEIYADQVQGIPDEYYRYRTALERDNVLHTRGLLSSGNDQLAMALLNKYKLSQRIVEFTICPPAVFSGDISIHSPLRLYYHGALFENRGLLEAILAMKQVEGAHLFIRGMGPYETVLREAVQEHHLQSKVTFLEVVPTEDLPKAALAFDIGVSLVRMNVLNHQYNVGFKTFENMAAGLALILPASYPLKKLNDQYQAGILYPDATVEHLVEVFNYCVDHPHEVKQWKQNARTAYLKTYNPEQQKQNLCAVIDELIAR